MREFLCVPGGFEASDFGVFAPITTAAGISVAGQATELLRVGDG